MQVPTPTGVPPLNGLVLAGGDSSRMRTDKGLIDYYGCPHREYLWHLLQPFTEMTFISCRPGQIQTPSYPILEDTWSDLGPFGAILTAFERYTDHAWLVVACDFPLLDAAAIHQLIQSRDPSAIATSFLDEKAGQAEPWISILEPAIYPVLLDYQARGRSSLRGVLQDKGSHVIKPLHPDILLNANTPEEVDQIRRRIQS